MTLQKKLQIIGSLILSGLIFVLSISHVAFAISSEQLKLFNAGIYYFDVNPARLCGGQQGITPRTGGGSLYVLGDSITVGMRDAGQLDEKLRANGWQPTKINAVGGENLRWGISQIQADQAIIAESRSMLIGLGTNNIGDVVSGSAATNGGKETVKRLMADLASAAKTANPDITLYWTSIYVTGSLTTSYGTFDMNIAMPIINEALSEVAAETGIAIIPYATSSEAPALTSSDGIHPSGKYTEMATYIASQIGASSTGTPAPSTNGCTCSTTSGTISGGLDRTARYREVWGYLTGKGLSEEATAGLMGNLEAESGIDPQNTQNDAPAPDGPEIPIDVIRGRWGYGIAQWTSAGRQDNLVAYARETGRPTGDLGLQLDFLWKELGESYAGVLAVMQTPGVTVDQASDEVILRFEIPESVLPPPRSTEQRKQNALSERRDRGRAIFNEFSGQSIASSLGTGCNSSGVSIDLENADTSGITCGGNTADAGIFDEYYFGEPRKIRLCRVGNTLANSQIASSLEQILADSTAAGLNLTFGAYRGMEQQISMYTSRCEAQGLTPTPAPYPKASYRDYQSCDSIAPPGYSNHQMGLAIDVSCDGATIPRYHPEANANACYQWLVANASRYGLYEFGKGEGSNTSGSYEAWHWSVDGR